MFGALRPAGRAMGAEARTYYRESYCYLAATLGRGFGITGRMTVNRGALLFYCLLAECTGRDEAMWRWSAAAAPRPVRCFRLCGPRPAPGDPLAEFIAALCCYLADVAARDDAADSPGWWTNLRARLSGKPGAQALERLADLGLRAEAVNDALADQQRIETRRGLPLPVYCEPAERAHRAVGHAAAGLLGLDAEASASVLGFVVHLARATVLADALLDYAEDMHEGRYNLLAWAFEPRDRAPASEESATCVRLVQCSLEGMAAAAGRLRCRRTSAITVACAAALATRLPLPDAARPAGQAKSPAASSAAPLP